MDFQPALPAGTVKREPILSADDSQHSARGIRQLRECRLHCVFITCFSHDLEFYQRLLAYSEIRLHRAETLDEADFLLTVTGSKVLISDTVFLDGSWEDALEMLSRVHSRASLLVAADAIDLEFVADAIDRGACGILWKPLDLGRLLELIRTVHEAALERLILDLDVLTGSTASPSCSG
jgi:DNA-binding NarL/FixJ family response regulator